MFYNEQAPFLSLRMLENGDFEISPGYIRSQGPPEFRCSYHEWRLLPADSRAPPTILGRERPG